MKAKGTRVGLARLCRLFGVSRQAFYQQTWAEIDVSLEEEIVIQQVKAIRGQQPRLGGRKLLVMLEPVLQEHQIKMGRDALFNLLAAHNLLVRRQKRCGPKTTDSRHRFKRWPNLTIDLKVMNTNELWVSDITYIALDEGFAYLSLLTDVYSHKILGWALHPSLETDGPLAALAQAITTLGSKKPNLIHHSDRGVQYADNRYVNLLQEYNIKISMTETGNPKENPIAERVNGILKQELIGECKGLTFEQASARIDQVVAIYNRFRPHMSIDYLTPEAAHLRNGELKNHWKKQYIK